MRAILIAASAALAAAVAYGADPGPTPSPSPNTQAFAAPHKQFLKALKPLPEIKLKPEPHLMGPEEVEGGPLLVTLDDVGAVSVLGADGQVRIARAGDGLEFGDSFQTGEKGSARVAFEKGVQVLAPPNVILHFDQVSLPGPGGGLDVPMVDLEQGEARFMVETAPKSDDDESPVLKPLKLLVRTKGAVFGVRGTDFILQAEGERTVLMMVTGVVEIAKDEHDLGMGRTAKAHPGESAELAAGKPLPKPEHYEMGSELKDFNDRYARLEGMWNAAVRDAKTHHLHAQFLAIRTRKVDVVNLKNGFASSEIRAEGKRLDDEKKKWELRKEGAQDEQGLNARGARNRRRRKKKPAPSPRPAPPASPAPESP